jgi:RNA polymerase sigma factor (sigma-70 family)
METKEQRFSRVVEEYKRTIYTVCYMFSKDEDEVNDLFQEILIRLWQGFDSFEGKSDIKTWIYRVSLNFCLNFDKKQKREAYERQQGICAHCGKHFELEEMEGDHITPWAEGGVTTAENCQMLCKECNRKKGAK